MTRELTPKSPSGRVKRTPIGKRNVLTVKDKDPDYVYRIVNVSDGKGSNRVEEFKEAGYEVQANSVGDKRVDTEAGLGKNPEFSVGQGMKAVVMRIRREYYDEDQEAKLAQVKAQEETIHQNAKADYGAITLSKS